MSRFIMRWPSLGLQVRCESLDVNREAFDLLEANLPIRAVQGHEMVGGWLLRDRALLLRRQPFSIPAPALITEAMGKAPVGRVSLLFPQGSTTELLVKYDQSVDDRSYVPVAVVLPEDLPLLEQAGKAQWRSATRTKEVIPVEFLREEELA